MLLLDIFIHGQSRERTRERYKAGHYGPAGLRPRAQDVAGWLAMVGR